MSFSFLKRSTPKSQSKKVKPAITKLPAITKSAKLDAIYRKYNVFPYVSPKRTKKELDAMASDPYSTSIVSKAMMRYLGKTKLLRGDIIALWWLINPHIKKDQVPEYFERRYGVNLKTEIAKLKKLGYLNAAKKITDAGKELLKKNTHIIEFHQTHNVNMTEKEWANFQKAKQADFESHNEYLRRNGQEKLAADNEAYRKRELQNRKNVQLIVRAKILENEGKLKEAAKILRSIDPKTANSPAEIYHRLAINARKQKDYIAEIKYIEEYLTNFNPTPKWQTVFQNRLTNAQKLLKKN